MDQLIRPFLNASERPDLIRHRRGKCKSLANLRETLRYKELGMYKPLENLDSFGYFPNSSINQALTEGSGLTTFSDL